MIRLVKSEGVSAHAHGAQLQDGLAHQGELGNIEHDLGVGGEVLGGHVIRVAFFSKRQVSQHNSQVGDDGRRCYAAV
jgi:hypothetical protein